VAGPGSGKTTLARALAGELGLTYLDNTWLPCSVPLVRQLPGSLVEVRCQVDPDVARWLYRSRQRDERHLDDQRTGHEL
jgi:cytidylate kinase